MSAMGDIIRTRRTELGISQRSMARTLGISHPYLAQVEQGKNGIKDPARIQLIADTLRLDVDTLHLARGDVPPDILQILLERPQLIQAVRTMHARLSARDHDTN